MKRKTRRTRLMLVALGVALGYFARFVVGPPAVEAENPNQFLSPLPDIKTFDVPEDDIDLEIIRDDEVSGLVPPVEIPFAVNLAGRQILDVMYLEDHTHGDDAIFEPHGEQVCASGCALSRHPTGNLSTRQFSRLLDQYRNGPLDSTNAALEELLFYGPQTRMLALSEQLRSLPAKHATFLLNELRMTHAKVSLRVIDSEGEIRTWLEPTTVPFDRRHVFDMKTKNLQPLVTSGTVKRVGLDHVWVRL